MAPLTAHGPRCRPADNPGVRRALLRPPLQPLVHTSFCDFYFSAFVPMLPPALIYSLFRGESIITTKYAMLRRARAYVGRVRAAPAPRGGRTPSALQRVVLPFFCPLWGQRHDYARAGRVIVSLRRIEQHFVLSSSKQPTP